MRTLSPENTVHELATGWCEADIIPALSVAIGSRDEIAGPWHFRHDATAAESSSDDAPEPIFLTASLTKPIVAMGLMRLVERGELTLAGRVVDLLPEFGSADRRAVTVRHLLTHTSGLPDQLPNNSDLRQATAPLDAFFAETCGVGLDFPPGRGMQYSSMGYLLLGEIIHRLSGSSCATFLQQEFFDPLGMTDTVLGAPDDWFTGDSTPQIKRCATVRVPAHQQGGDDWNWNSRYWRQLGAPWGGLLSTASDLARFCRMMLQCGWGDRDETLSASTVHIATSDQTACLRDLPESDRRTRPWGLGWRLNWPGHPATFGDLLSPTAFGHWGATGTLMWIDPARDQFAVVLSTQPTDGHRAHLIRLSNVIAAMR